MWQEPIIATVAIFALLALGEYISVLSRARIPTLMTAMLGFLIFTWIGVFPEDILDLSTLPSLGALLIGPLIVHMGTLMRFDILKSQWKAVVIALSGLIGSLTLVLTLVTLMFDFPTAASGVGPLSGGVLALLITNERLTELGMTSLIVVPVLVYAFQGIVGMPISTFFMKRYGHLFMTGQINAKDTAKVSLKEEPVKYKFMQNERTGTYLVPTLLAPVSVLEFSDELGMAQTSIDKSKEVIEIHKESFTRAYKAGVKIAMGTDAGVFKHGTNLRELELMVECGMTPMDAILASTQTAAECMGYTDLGLIKEGYVADFILTKENPLDDIGVLKTNEEIKVVAKEGNVFKNIM
ncbi:amidohydrolase family protein [Lacicoccus qingdaonensis]|uniref:Amidohydrolase family protein n=1 Tax=Lacicoccus qingdaonensis TaxID=576118 RepID=A0A1G9HGV6_9BACL|nr:amidohydrolase family protein [Salinicoccus qingdaonensis]SDL11743.1 Amidohydrolase family protein [Salinicoccus qingdaonensis]